MLKHCQGSSVRLQRRLNIQPDSVSLNSNATIRSNGESEDSSLNSSFNINTHDPTEIFNVRNVLYDRSVYGYATTPDPISLSSRTSSYASLAADSAGGPRTPIKVFASCLRPDIEYKTISVGSATTAKEVIWQLLSKFRMKHRDPKLFFLTMEVVIQKPGRDGLTKKTLVLEDDSKPAELKLCNPWGECKFTLQMRKGGLVKVYDSVLMEESQYKCLLISEETSVEDVIKILLHCYGLEKIERADRYCMYEQCNSQRYQRRLAEDDRPLIIQGLWPGPTPFSFVLRRSPLRLEDNVWNNKPRKLPEKTGESRNSEARDRVTQRSWSVVTEWTNQDRVSNQGDSFNRFNSNRDSLPHRLNDSKHKEVVVISTCVNKRGKEAFPRELEEESWPELDKDSEEHVSSGEDMDTSLSSNDSPTPPLLTSTPLCPGSRPALKPPENPVDKPKMSFLYPSPDYESFPNKFAPSRPYSSLSTSSLSLSTTLTPAAPSLPPKPASLVSLFSRSSSSSSTGFHDYENYFYI